MVELPDHFTAHADARIDRVVAAHVARVGEELSRIMPDFRALFLVGGFARGEGSVLAEGGQLRPVNDYDFALVTEARRDWSNLVEIGRRLAREIGIRAVDLLPFRTRDLPGLKHSIFNYDLVTCGKLVVGDPGIRRLFPRLMAGHIPVVEGTILLVNRMFCLLESYREQYDESPPEGEDAFFCHQQGCKAVLACQDALLVMQRRYHHRYIERMLRLQETPCCVEGLKALSREATRFKLRPERVSGDDAVRVWSGGRRVLLGGLQTLMNESSWIRIERDYLTRSIRRRLLERLAALRGGGEDRRKGMIEMAELWLLVSMDESEPGPGLRAAARRLAEAGVTVEEPLVWEDVRRKAVRAWMDVTH